MPDKSTQPRLDVTKVSPDLLKAMAGLEKYVEASGLEQKLLDLVKIRASQINGCAYCIVMHTNDARKHGESDEWMHLLNAWDEAPIYSARERAALAWTEAVTKISDGHAPDEVYDEARKYFSAKELVDLDQRLESGRDFISCRCLPPFALLMPKLSLPFAPAGAGRPAKRRAAREPPPLPLT